MKSKGPHILNFWVLPLTKIFPGINILLMYAVNWKASFTFFTILGTISPKKEIQTIYYALVYSRIKYGINVYGQAGSSKIVKIQILQNQLLKVLSEKNYRHPTEKLHKDLELLLVDDIAKQELLTFVHQYFSNSLPPVFDNYFDSFNHHHATRNGPNTIRLKNHNTEMAAASVQVKSAKLWNVLDISYKTITTRKNFRTKISLIS